MRHYSHRSNRVTKQNLRAFFDELENTDGLMDRTSSLTWDEVWGTINRFQSFWCRYYANQDVVVEVNYTPPKDWKQYLAEVAEQKQALEQTRFSDRVKKAARSKTQS